MSDIARLGVDPAEYDRNAQYETLRNQVTQEALLSSQQERATKQKVSSILSEPTPSLVQQGAGLTTPKDTGETDRTPVIASLQQRSQTLLEQARKMQSPDPKLANTLTTQARELEDTAISLGKEQLAEQKDVMTHITGWAGTIKDQSSLDMAKQVVESRHPGTWAAMKLPETYDGESAPKFRQLALSAETGLKQVETEIKQIESLTAGRYYEAKTKKEEADAVTARIKEASAQQKLKKDNSEQTRYEKYQTEIEKETNLYATSLSKERAKILADVKKYPPTVKAPSLREQAWANTFGDPIKPEPSARDKALAMVEQEQKTAHDSRMAAIETKAQRLGIAPANKTAKPAQSQYVEGKVYTDANGNKAKWNGSDWEPQ
jgi:hypothetical protein